MAENNPLGNEAVPVTEGSEAHEGFKLARSAKSNLPVVTAPEDATPEEAAAFEAARDGVDGEGSETD